jgi:hypothetical protein
VHCSNGSRGVDKADIGPSWEITFEPNVQTILVASHLWQLPNGCMLHKISHDSIASFLINTPLRISSRATSLPTHTNTGGLPKELFDACQLRDSK